MAGTVSFTFPGTGTGEVEATVDNVKTTYASATTVTIPDGKRVLLHGVPAAPSDFRWWLVNGAKKWADFTFTVTAGTTTVQGVFDLRYTIAITNVTAGGGSGNVSLCTGSKTDYVPANTAKSFTMHKNDWYRMTILPTTGSYGQWTVNDSGPSFALSKSGTITDNITFVATFKPATPRTVALSFGGGGSGNIEMTVGGVKTVYLQPANVTINEGTIITIHAAPATGSQLHWWEVNGTTQYGDKTYVVVADIAIKAVFDIRRTISVTSTIVSGGGGALELCLGSPKYPIPAGQPWTMTVWDKAWFRFTPIPATGTTVTFYINGVGPFSSAKSGNANANINVTATFAGAGTPLSATISPVGGTSILGGESFTFSARAVGGLTPYKYQWQINGRNIASATKTSYAVTAAVETSDEGLYQCVVADNNGTGTTVRSDLSELLVNGRPRFEVSCAGTRTVYHNFNPNGYPMSETFFSPTVGYEDPTFQLGMSISGMEIFVDMKFAGPFDAYRTNQADFLLTQTIRDGSVWMYCLPGTDHWYRKDNIDLYYNGSLIAPGGSNHPLPLVSGPAIPVWSIATQSANQSAKVGETVIFSVMSNTPKLALRYQWYVTPAGGTETPITGAVWDYLLLEDAIAADAGSYRCSVTDASGRIVWSAAMALAVTPAS